MVTHNVFRKMQGRGLSGPTIKRGEGSGLTIQLLWQSRSKRSLVMLELDKNS